MHTFTYDSPSPGVWLVRHNGVSLGMVFSDETDAKEMCNFLVQRQTHDASFGDRISP